MILSIPILAVLACGTDHHSVARVDASSGSDQGAPAGASSGGSTGKTGGTTGAHSSGTGGDSNPSAGAPASSGGEAAAGASTSPSGGTPSGGAASGGLGAAASGGVLTTGGTLTRGGSSATGGTVTHTGGRSTGTGGSTSTGGASSGDAGSAGTGTCPAELPLIGSCSSEGLSCHCTGCTPTRDYCTATAACTDGSWEIGYTDCECVGSGGTTGAGGSSSAGDGGEGGASSACEFTYSTPAATSATCEIASDSQNSCGEAAQCICAGTADVESCVTSMVAPRGGPTFSDYCGPTSSRSLGSAVQMMAEAYAGTATVSEGCAEIPATLDL
jgi:hypothetical protein